MSSQQLDEEAVFHVARRIGDAAARSDYLDQVCAGDQSLRDRVNSLLEVHEQEQIFLKSAPEATKTVDHAPITEAAGQQIGRFKLLQKIGEGGFGVVYMAEQTRPVRRKVALKIIKPGMDTHAVVARFEAERQALALMDHPNIARVLDGGATDSGRPYFVMELVKGVPITEYCDKNHLPTSERLELFTTICQAVQHAHQKGIIHRDLKPSNILVTLADGKPVVKVIDFGVSKALNQQLTEKTLFTAYGQMIGTPQYMSPEQAEMSCLDVDTRSDIYSLGVVLYEFLTGTTPLEGERLRTAGFAEMQRIIQEEEPPKPSVRLSSAGEELTVIAKHRSVTPERLHKTVRGDLDWIVMKALEKERRRRYETATEFANDIQRYLRDDPVVACPPSRWYRAKKSAIRHRVKLAVASAILLTLVAGTIALAVAVYQTETARRSVMVKNDELVEALAREEAASSELQRREYRHLVNLAFYAWNDGNREEFQQYGKTLRDHSQHGQMQNVESRLLLSYYDEMKGVPEVPTGATVSSIDYSADGQRIVVGCTGKDPMVFDTRTHSLVGRIGDEQLHHVNYSCAGDLLAVSSSGVDGRSKVQVFRVTETGDSSTFVWEIDQAACAVFSTDAMLIACATVDGIAVLDSRSGKSLQVLPYRIARGPVTIAFSSNGLLAASCHYQKDAYVWNLDTGEELFRIESPAWIQVLSFSPDGKHLISAGEFGVKVWQYREDDSFELVRETDDPAICGEFSPDGKYVALGCSDYKIRVLEAELFRPVARLLQADFVSAIAFSPQGQQLAAGGRDRRIRFWDAQHWERPQTRRTFEDYHPALAASVNGLVAFAEDGKKNGELQTLLKTWNPDTGEERIVAELKSGIKSLAFSVDGRWLASGQEDGSVRVWNLVSGELLHEAAQAHGDFVYAVAFSPNGEFLISGGRGPGLQRWDMDSFEVEPLKGHAGEVWCLSFSSEGILASGGKGRNNDCGDTIFWDVDARKELSRIEHPRFVRSVQFSPTNPEHVAVTYDFSAAIIKTFNWRMEEELCSFQGHSSKTIALAYSPDGTRLVTGSDDRTLRFWDAATGDLVGKLEVGDRTRKIAFLGDGRFATASWEGSINVFDPR